MPIETTNASLSLQGLLSLLPVILCSLTAVCVMLGIAIKRNYFVNATIAVIGLNASLLAVWWVSRNPLPQAVTDLFVVDSFACVYMALVLMITLAC